MKPPEPIDQDQTAGAARRLWHLKAKFAGVSDRYHRSLLYQRVKTKAGLALNISLIALTVCTLLYSALAVFSPWTPLVTIRHLVAFPNCNAARLVALAPAPTGEPGYWPQHDADSDGIACEPLTFR